MPFADPYLAPLAPIQTSTFTASVERAPRSGMPAWAIVVITAGGVLATVAVLFFLGGALLFFSEGDEGWDDSSTAEDAAVVERWSHSMPTMVGDLPALPLPEQVALIGDHYGPAEFAPRSTTMAVYGDEDDQVLVTVDISRTALTTSEQADWRAEVSDYYEGLDGPVELSPVLPGTPWLGCAEAYEGEVCIATDERTIVEMTFLRSAGAPAATGKAVVAALLDDVP